jgi:hypothetical protein
MIKSLTKSGVIPAKEILNNIEQTLRQQLRLEALMSSTVNRSFRNSPIVKKYYDHEPAKLTKVERETRWSNGYKVEMETRLGIACKVAKSIEKFQEDYSEFDPYVKKHDTTNAIQLNEAAPKRQGFINKELKHVRTSLGAQVLATLGLFSNNLELLDKTEYQYYLEKNIFDPGLLIDLTDAHNQYPKQFIQKFDDFINQGVAQHSKDGLPTKASVFLLKLSQKVHDYLGLENSAEALKNINKQINILLKEKKHKDIDVRVLRALHLQRILLLANSINEYSYETALALSKDPVYRKQFYQQYFESKLIVNAITPMDEYTDYLENTSLEEARRFIDGTIKKFMPPQETEILSDHTVFKNTLPYLLKDFVFSENIQIFPEAESQNNHNSYCIKEGDKTLCRINLQKGEIYTDKNLSNMLLPDNVKNNSTFISMFGSNVKQAFGNATKDYFEFTCNDLEYRVIKPLRVGQKKIRIQRNFGSKDSPQWYEWHKLAGGTALDPTGALPVILMEDKAMWIEVTDKNTPNILIENLISNCVEFSCRADDPVLRQVTKDLKPTEVKLLPKNAPVYNAFKHFEDPKFFLVLEKELPNGDSECQVQFLRYGLTLTGKRTQGENWIFTLTEDNVDWTLTFPKKLEDTDTFSGSNSSLIFSNAKGDKKIVSPMQPFVVEAELSEKKIDQKTSEKVLFFSKLGGGGGAKPQSTGREKTEYFNLIPDTQDLVRRFENGQGEDKLSKLLTKINKAKETKDLEKLKAYTNELKALPSLKYVGTGHVAKYELKNEEVVAGNSEDNLYLAYTYLCNQEPDKAFAILDGINLKFGGLSGTPREIEYLRWIIESTPAIFKEEQIKPHGASANPVAIETPEMHAVKLKALLLLVRFNTQSQNLDVFRKKLGYPEKTFHEKLGENIKNIYEKYHNTETNVPIEYQLAPYEKLELLRAHPPHKLGAVAVASRRLEIIYLMLELSNLKQAPYTETNNTRILEIEQILEKTKTVECEGSIMDFSPFEFPTLRGWQLKLTELQGKQKKLNLEPLTEENIIQAMCDSYNKNEITAQNIDNTIENLIKIPVDEMLFLRLFPSLVKSILNDTLKGEVSKIALKSFCENAIIAYAKIEQGKWENNFPQMCMILHVILTGEKNKFTENELSSSSNASIREMQSMLSGLVSSYNKVLKENKTSFSQILIYGFSPELKPLTTSSEILKTLKGVAQDEKNLHDNIKLQVPVPVNENPSVFVQLSVNNPELKTLGESLLDINAKTSKEIEDLIKLKKNGSIDDLDTEVGALKRKADTEHLELVGNKIATIRIDDIYKLVEEKIGSEKEKNGLLESTKNEWNIIENLANEKIKNLSDAEMSSVEIQLGFFGRQVKALKKNDLLGLFLKNDILEYRKKTGLSDNKIQELHQKIAQYLAHMIEKQQLERVKEKIDDYKKDKKDSMLALEILEEVIDINKVDVAENPELMVLQYYQNILVRDEQKKHIKNLLVENKERGGFDNKIVQLIMGGGKTTVLLLTLALKRANGTNLSIIEVPEALFKTNYAELKARSLELFGQDPQPFLFDRDTDCSAVNLKLLYRHLHGVIANRNYLVTTGSSVQSLDLKYAELLDCGPGDDPSEWYKQIKWLDRIIKTFKNQGDALIDEIDSNLDIKKQLNYTVGAEKAIPRNHIQFMIKLYTFIENTDEIKKILDPKEIDNIKDNSKRVVDFLTTSDKSPLHEIFSDTSKEDFEEIKNYLNNKGNDVPKCIKDLSKENRALLAFTKSQINDFFPYVLTRNLYEHYGPSKNPKKSALQKAVAIPYAGNNNPRELCAFGNYFSTMHYTILSLHQLGANPESYDLFKEVIHLYKEQAQHEIFENPKMNSPDNTEIGQALKTFFKLSEISLLDDAALRQYFEKFRTSISYNDFIPFILEKSILPQIEVAQKTLTHNSHNHVGKYRSVEGFTGTPWNYRTIHQSVPFDPLSSIGTDGLTIARLRDKVKIVRILEKGKSFLDQAFEASDLNLRAIIDVGSFFKGISNKQVAEDIAKKLNPKRGKDKKEESKLEEKEKQEDNKYEKIKYVLFFEKNSVSGLDELYALDVKNENKEPIFIGGDNEKLIAKKLNDCPLDERFTYFDQIHTIGANIKQSANAKAIVTLDKNTLKKDLLQGVMRMRGFKANQTVDIWAANDVKFDIKPDNKEKDEKEGKEKEEKNKAEELKEPDIESVLTLTSGNQDNRLENDDLAAALLQMQHEIRDDFERRILAVSSKYKSLENAKKDVRRKAFLQKIFNPYFIQGFTEDLEVLYGSIPKEMPTKKVFDNAIKKLMDDWTTLLGKASITFSDYEKAKLEDSLKKIKTNAEAYCAEETVHKDQDIADQAVETQREQTQEQEQEQEQELEIEKENKNKISESLVYKWWLNKNDTLTFMANQNELLKVKPLKEISQNTDYTPDFNENIRTSCNFYNTYQEQGNNGYLHKYQKPIHVVLMVQTKDKLEATIVTYEEEKVLRRLIKDMSLKAPNYIWVENTEGTIFSGLKPAPEALNDNYNTLFSQLCFFNGDSQALTVENMDIAWLMEDLDAKCDFLKKYIMPYRGKEDSSVMLLKERILGMHLSHIEILSHRSNKGNTNPLQAFSAFLNDLEEKELKEDSVSESLKMNNRQKYYSPYYLKIILENGDRKDKENYLRAFLKDKPTKPIDALIAKLDPDNFLNVLFMDPLFRENKEFQELLLSRFHEKFWPGVSNINDYYAKYRFFNYKEANLEYAKKMLSLKTEVFIKCFSENFSGFRSVMDEKTARSAIDFLKDFFINNAGFNLEVVCQLFGGENIVSAIKAIPLEDRKNLFLNEKNIDFMHKACPDLLVETVLNQAPVLIFSLLDQATNEDAEKLTKIFLDNAKDFDRNNLLSYFILEKNHLPILSNPVKRTLLTKLFQGVQYQKKYLDNWGEGGRQYTSVVQCGDDWNYRLPDEAERDNKSIYLSPKSGKYETNFFVYYHNGREWCTLEVPGDTLKTYFYMRERHGNKFSDAYKIKAMTSFLGITPEGLTPLLFAVHGNKDIKLIEFLVEQSGGVDLNETIEIQNKGDGILGYRYNGDKRISALFTAAENKNWATVKFLLSRSQGEIPRITSIIARVAEEKQWGLVMDLLKKVDSININEEPGEELRHTLKEAYQYGQFDVVEYLIKGGIDNCLCDPQKHLDDKNGVRVFNYLNPAQFEKLIDIIMKTDTLYKENSWGYTILFQVAHIDYPNYNAETKKFFEHLKRQPIDWFRKTAKGDTPLNEAVRRGNVELIKLVLENKKYVHTPLDIKALLEIAQAQSQLSDKQLRWTGCDRWRLPGMLAYLQARLKTEEANVSDSISNPLIVHVSEAEEPKGPRL